MIPFSTTILQDKEILSLWNIELFHDFQNKIFHRFCAHYETPMIKLFLGATL